MIRPRSLAATAVVVATLSCSSSAFSPSTRNPIGPHASQSLLQVTSMPTRHGVSGKSFEDENHHQYEEGQQALPHGVHAPVKAINSPQELAEFLEEDDRICVIKFHAAWCKSCQRFGHKFQGLANQKVDWISDSDHSVVKEGEVRFGSIEFGANTGMCRALKIKRLPSIHIYQNGEQLEAFPCGPKKFPILLEKLNHYLHPEMEEPSFEEILEQGNQLMNSNEVAVVLQQMIEQDADGRLESASTASTKKIKKSWWNILP